MRTSLWQCGYEVCKRLHLLASLPSLILDAVILIAIPANKPHCNLCGNPSYRRQPLAVLCMQVVLFTCSLPFSDSKLLQHTVFPVHSFLRVLSPLSSGLSEQASSRPNEAGIVECKSRPDFVQTRKEMHRICKNSYAAHGIQHWFLALFAFKFAASTTS